jgi:hypothetical protein
MNLLEKLLELDPKKRLTASRALVSRYFLAEPKAPENPEELPPLELGEGGHFHEFQTKKKRREAKKVAEQAKDEALELGKSSKEAHAVFEAIYKETMAQKVLEGTLNESDVPEVKPDERESSKKAEKRKEHKDRKKDKERKSDRRDREERDKKKKRKRDSKESRRSSGSGSEKDKDPYAEKASRKHKSSRRDDFSPEVNIPEFSGDANYSQEVDRQSRREYYDDDKPRSSREKEGSHRRHRDKSHRSSRDDRKSRDRDYDESNQHEIDFREEHRHEKRRKAGRDFDQSDFADRMTVGDVDRDDTWRREQERNFQYENHPSRPGPSRDDVGPYGHGQNSRHDEVPPPAGDYGIYGPASGNGRSSSPPARSRFSSERSPPRDYGPRGDSFDPYGPPSRLPPMRDGPRDRPRDPPLRSRSPDRYQDGPPRGGPPERDGFGPRGGPPRRGRGRGRGRGRR